MKIKNFIFVALLGALVMLGGCADKHYDTYETYVEGGNAYIISYNDLLVDKWTWNDGQQRYESGSFALKDLNKDIFEYGTAVVSMFIDEDGVEVTKNLPYEKDYFKDVVVGGETNKVWLHTQRISFDMSENDVVFFVESTGEFELQNAYFKVVILWDGIIDNK